MNKQVEHILVIDDDAFLSEILSETLVDSGFEVKTLADGQAALDYLAANRIDLVILDIRLPGLNGYEVLKEIRKRSEIPVIMLTGVTEPEAIVWSLELGAVDYIKKPFQANELVARVRAKLRRTKV